MEERMYRRKEEWKNGYIEERKNVRKEEWKKGRMEERKNERMEYKKNGRKKKLDSKHRRHYTICNIVDIRQYAL